MELISTDFSYHFLGDNFKLFDGNCLKKVNLYAMIINILNLFSRNKVMVI